MAAEFSRLRRTGANAEGRRHTPHRRSFGGIPTTVSQKFPIANHPEFSQVRLHPLGCYVGCFIQFRDFGSAHDGNPLANRFDHQHQNHSG
jgi:hypothetical protein